MSPRVRSILYSAAALVAFIGVTEASYLFVLFLTGETATCGGSPDCGQVLGSAYAKIGPIPVSGLGACAYFIAFASAIFAAFGHGWARKFFVLVITAMFAATLWFLYVQSFILHTFCGYCLFSAAVIFLLAGTVVMIPTSDSVRNP